MDARGMRGKGRSDLFFMKFEEGRKNDNKICIPKLIQMK